MNAALLAGITFVIFGLGYRYYSRFLADRVFAVRQDESVPSREFEDGVDFVPTRLGILWGHHYTSIAGAAPIVGPALAVIWGWLPALIWVTVGTVMMGAVHDFAALVMSARNRGRSIGDFSGEILNARVRTVMLIVISLLIWIVLAVFAFIIGTLFVSYPGSILPINVQILVALLLGWLVHRRGLPALAPSLLAYGVLLVCVFYGDTFAAAFPGLAEISVLDWVWILLLYCFVASVLPVWVLLQPRDYINSHQLVTALILLSLGLLILQPTVQAPAIRLAPPGAPSLLPFLFITIACGAISGFHGLVASGTTSKQLAKMGDARPIGYGGMIGEGTLGMLAVLATTAGFATSEQWYAHYADWNTAQGLSAKLDAFVLGGGRFVAAIGIPIEAARTFMAVVVIAFAATSLDTGARIQRLVISELGEAAGLRPLTNRYVASGIGISLALLLAITQGGGQGGLILWPLFGSTNQLLASVTLLVVSVWLRRQGRPVLYTFIPMVFLSTVTFVAMTQEVFSYASQERWLLLALGGLILVCDVFVLFEGLRLFARAKPDSARA